MMTPRGKLHDRLTKGLCLNCGHEVCTCRKWRKHLRKYIADPLKSAKGKWQYIPDPVAAFKALVYRITEDIYGPQG